MTPPTNEMVAAMYHRVLRKPEEGTITAAARKHQQACGLVAYVFDLSLDAVAHAVRDDYRQKHMKGMIPS